MKDTNPGHTVLGFPFIHGRMPSKPGSLARYLPPIPDGVVTIWLAKNLPQVPVGEDLLSAQEKPWVLDPFGAAPRIVIEAARAGYRVLVAANNPIARFLVEMSANPPSEADLRSVLAELAAAHRGEERIEPTIRSLYETECGKCGQMVMAEAFLWEHGAQVPYARIYHCTHCGDYGERTATNADTARAAHFAATGLHRARALERVAPLNDPDRIHAEEALAAYLPRAIFALFTLINKLDGLTLTPNRRNYLIALLLTACDQANTLWSHPTARERPRQITIPPRFRENNVWLALEEGVHLWASSEPPLLITIWPQLPPPSGGICLFEGRLKDLGSLVRTETKSLIKVGAVMTALPRPNQAFWTLCALWTGWLWGREAAGPFKSVLRRRRYDWSWHTTALSATLSNLAPLIIPGTPLFGIIAETEPGFLTAAMTAADITGFNLQGISLSDDNGQAQITWQYSGQISEAIKSPSKQSLDQIAGQSAAYYLREKGEPADYIRMYTAALSGMAEANVLRYATALRSRPAISETQVSQESAEEASPADNFNQSQATIKEVLTYRGGFLRYGATDSAESGQWWLREDSQSNLPLADRVEAALMPFLGVKPNCTISDIEQALSVSFPGLLTADLELIQVCLDSYGEQTPPDSGRWHLRPQDDPVIRRADLEEVNRQLKELGERLGFSVEGQFPILWLEPDHQARYRFYPIASAVLGEIIFRSGSPPLRSLIVLPGGRANLVAYKLRRDPHLDQAIDAGWRFLKYRHLRWLLVNQILSREVLDDELERDPLTYTAPQMRFL